MGSRPSVCPLHQCCLGQQNVKLRCFTEKIRNHVFQGVRWKRPCAEQQKAPWTQQRQNAKDFGPQNRIRFFVRFSKEAEKRMGANGNEGGAKLRRSDFILFARRRPVRDGNTETFVRFRVSLLMQPLCLSRFLCLM